MCWGRVSGALLVVVLAVPAHLAQEPSYRYVFYDGDEAEYDSLQVHMSSSTFFHVLRLFLLLLIAHAWKVFRLVFLL